MGEAHIPYIFLTTSYDYNITGIALLKFPREVLMLPGGTHNTMRTGHRTCQKTTPFQNSLENYNISIFIYYAEYNVQQRVSLFNFKHSSVLLFNLR